MTIDISRKNEERLRTSAEKEGVTLDSYVEQLLNEREEFILAVQRAAARVTTVSQEEARAKIERGYLQSERGQVVDGETFADGLLAELNDTEHQRRTG